MSSGNSRELGCQQAIQKVIGQVIGRAWAAGRLSPGDLDALIAAEVSDPRRMQAWNQGTTDLPQRLAERFELLLESRASLMELAQAQGLSAARLLPQVWQLWLPLAIRLAQQRRQQERSLIQGLLGLQGTGKTTLGLGLILLLEHLGYRALSLSIDDFYKTHAERLALRQQDPQLRWRGPPGTHDVARGIAVLDQLRQTGPDQAIAIPQFDKALAGGSGDRMGDRWVQGIDIVIFEGWFVGVQPVDPQVFATMLPLPPPIKTAADIGFARACNGRLADYLPLWQRLDQLWVLLPSDFQLSKQWRCQAEQRLRAAGRGAMAAPEVDAFVDYYWKALHPELFVRPLTQAGSAASLVVEVGAGHSIERIYRPGA